MYQKSRQKKWFNAERRNEKSKRNGVQKNYIRSSTLEVKEFLCHEKLEGTWRTSDILAELIKFGNKIL